LVEPAGRYSKAARKGLLAHKQVSQAYYNECLEVCRRNIAGGTA
jgi:hypothetical protein